MASALDKKMTTSCGHTWTLRNTACPECFREMRKEREALAAFLAGMEKGARNLDEPRRRYVTGLVAAIRVTVNLPAQPAAESEEER